jgi:hypothetical protein
LRAILHEWHPGIGSALLQSLDLPESVSRACDEHELAPSVLPPGSLSELISLSNRCAASRPTGAPPECAAKSVVVRDTRRGHALTRDSRRGLKEVER